MKTIAHLIAGTALGAAALLLSPIAFADIPPQGDAGTDGGTTVVDAGCDTPAQIEGAGCSTATHASPAGHFGFGAGVMALGLAFVAVRRRKTAARS